MSNANQEIKNRAVLKMMMNGVLGGHKKQIDTLKTRYFQSHEEKEAEEALREMARDPSAPVEQVGGGHRDTVRLTNKERAKEYLKDNGADLPWVLQGGIRIRGRQQ